MLILMLTFMCWSKGVKAQDPQFSQFYAAPLYLNPALTGSTDRARMGLNYRNQWPSLQHAFTTLSAYVDYFSKAAESGIGLMVTEHREGFLDFKSTEMSALYSYKMQVSSDVVLRTGIQMSYFQKNFNFEKLIFGNQIDIVNGQVIGPSGEVFDRGANVDFLSVSAGMLLYSNRTWIGFSTHHINQPNQSFAGQESLLNRKYSIHMGHKIMFSKGKRLRTVAYQFQERSATFAVNFKKQGGFNQLDVGAQLYFQPLVLGAWYRGIPIQSVNEVFNNESIIALLGLEVTSDMSVGYSYDFTVSGLAGATGGAHEFSLTLSFGKIVKRTRRDTILPCFKY